MTDLYEVRLLGMLRPVGHGDIPQVGAIQSGTLQVGILQVGPPKLALTRFDEADKALQASLGAFDEALSRAPDDSWTYSNKGDALSAPSEQLATCHRPEEAAAAYAEAAVA